MRKGLTPSSIEGRRGHFTLRGAAPRNEAIATLRRTLGGSLHEVDLVLEDAGGDIVGIEVKAGASVTSSDFKGLRFMNDSLGVRFRRGIVLYTGEQSVPFGEKLVAHPVTALWELFRETETVS